MVLNDAGQMVKKWYVELENKFQGIRCGEYIRGVKQHGWSPFPGKLWHLSHDLSGKNILSQNPIS